MKRFETVLGKTYPHRAFVPKTGTWGVGFASKRPLINVRTGPVEPSKIPAMEASVTHDGQRVQLLCVHLVPPVGKRKKSDTFLDELAQNGDVRSKQADTLVARYAKTKTPVVLLGDFNEEPAGEALMKFEKAGWKRGCSFCGATFPGPKEPWPAVFTIDHVYARGLEFIDAKTIRAGGSDHFPVAAKLTLQRPQ